MLLKIIFLSVLCEYLIYANISYSLDMFPFFPHFSSYNFTFTENSSAWSWCSYVKPSFIGGKTLR